jgi:hypothetical protein
MDHYKLIGRALSQLDYNLSVAIKRQVTPMLTDTSVLPEIHAFVYGSPLFSHYDEYMKKLLFVGSVYDMYCPGAFFGKAIMKMPIGIRDEVRNAMGERNAEMVNYYLEKSKVFLKFRNKAFGQEVAIVVAEFKKYSVLAEDWQLELA